MSSKSATSTRSTAWLWIVTVLALIAIAAFLMSKKIDSAVGNVIEEQEPQLGLPLQEIIHEKPVSKALSREDESWDKIKMGSISLELPGDPTEDPKPGWFSSYTKVQTLAAYRVPVEHRLSHVRVSAIRNSSGKISIKAAALAAKHGMDSELSGTTTIFPFNFRNLPGRHISSRPLDADDDTRMHTYLVINNDEMLILTITGHKQHPSRLAHQILKTIEFSKPTTAALQPRT